jgi:methyl-accepting chemotaxis protein
MIGFSFRLTHKVMAIALIGLLSLVAFGTIYFVGRNSQDASRTASANIRNIADLNQKLAIDMLQARRAEMEFQLRHDQSYAKRHAEISADVGRDIERLRSDCRGQGLRQLRRNSLPWSRPRYGSD